jgi:PAS domain S-box-containing protein
VDSFYGPVLFACIARDQLAAARRRRPTTPSFDRLEGHLLVLLENATHITVIVEPDGLVRYVSPVVERMLGYPSESLKGVPVASVVHPDDAAAVADALASGLRHPGRGPLIQFRAQHRDGSWRVLEAIVTNRLDDPQIAGMVIDARDVTERKWSAERLQQSLETLLAIHDVGRLLGSSLEQHAIGAALLEGAHRVAPIEAAALWLVTARGQLRVSGMHGAPAVWEAARHSRPARVARRTALRTGTPELFRFAHKKDWGAPAEGCALPLRVHGRVVGVLELQGPGPAVTWPIDELGILADQAASALERARLYQALSERERRLECLVRQLLLTQEEERRRFAYEVHDGLAQLATAAEQHLEAFASHYHTRSPQREGELRKALDLSGRIVQEARRMIAGLRPTVLDERGLAAAISLELHNLRAEGWQAEFTDHLGDLRLDPTVETALFRVLQEALANVRKHAASLRVAVRLERDSRSVQLEVRDWGRGFQPSAVRRCAGPSERVGLAGIQERIALLRGRCTIHSRPGAGARIRVEVPLR